MRRILLPLLFIIILPQCFGCAVATAWLDGKEYVENVIAGRVKVDKPAVDLTGEWKVSVFYATTWDCYSPEQDKRGTITLKPFGNGWTGEMDYVDINYENRRTIQETDVVLSGDKLTIFVKGVIFDEWEQTLHDIFTAKWNPIKQEFSGSSIGKSKFTMKR